MKTSGVSMPPEWLDTTSAPPDDGTLSMLRTSARWYCLINGPTVFATCLVNSGSHLAVSRFFGAFAMCEPSRLPINVSSMLLSFLENVISVYCGPISDWETMAEKVLVTGGFGLVGSQTVRRLAADGHRVVATDLGTPAQRTAAASLAANAEARR